MQFKKLWGIVCTQLVVLILLIACWRLACKGTMHTIDVQLEKWESQQATWETGWLCPSGTATSISSPFLTILKGTYTIEVDYSSDTYETMTMTAPENMHYFVHGGNILLYPLRHTVKTDFTIDHGIDNLVLSLTTTGKGNVQICGIRIFQNRNDFGQFCAFYCICIFLLDIYLFQRYIWRWNKRLIFGFYVLLLFSSLPLLIPGIQMGQDLRFHFMRLEGLWREMAGGYIPSRVQSAWFGGYGYPVSIYYGDILLYPAAILRIMGVPLVKAYKFYLFMINYLTVMSAVVCFKQMSGSEWKAFLLSAAYTLANYRLYDVYIRAGVGEMSAFIFYPIILLGFYEMIGQETFSMQIVLRDAGLISVGLSGIICNHMLSGEMTLITFALVCLFYLPHLLNKQSVVTLMLGALLSFALAAYFAIPFLNTYCSIDVAVNGSLTGGNGHMIQQLGAFWGQYFAFTEKIDGYSVEEVSTRFALTPGPLLMIALLLGIAALYLNEKQKCKQLWRPVILAVLMLFISSDLFPWNVLALKTKIGRVLAQVQFPWRYLSMAVIFLSVVLFFLLEYKEVYKYRLTVTLVVLGICCYSTCDYLSQYISGAITTDAWDMGEISDSAAMNYEYWRKGTDGEFFTWNISASDGIIIDQYEQKGLRTAVNCSADRDGTITLPQVNYGNMIAFTNDGQMMEVGDGENNQVKISIPKGFKGWITCDYKEPLCWRICECVSIIAFVCCIIFIRQGGRCVRDNKELVDTEWKT